MSIRRDNPDGDVIAIDGSIVRKHEEGRHLVEIQQYAITFNEVSATGAAVVELPSRA